MDLNYLHHREGVERMRAQTAISSNARESHLSMASEYRQQIERLRRNTARSHDLAGPR